MLTYFDRVRTLYIFVDALKKGFGVIVGHLLGDARTATPVRTKV